MKAGTTTGLSSIGLQLYDSGKDLLDSAAFTSIGQMLSGFSDPLNPGSCAFGSDDPDPPPPPGLLLDDYARPLAAPGRSPQHNAAL